MKILQLIQKPQLRGAEVFAAQLSNHLTHLGHQVIIVALFDGSAELAFSDVRKLNASAGRKYYDFKAWRRLADLIKDEKPDIVQANAGDTLKYAIFSKQIFGWKQPVFFRNASTISLYIKSPAVKRLYHFLFAKTDKVISVSQASAADFSALFPHCRQKISVIPIGIERNEQVENKMFQNPFRDKNQFPVLLHVGGFSFEKNHKGLIDIFNRIRHEMPTAHLHLVGDGPLKAETEAYVKACALQNQVHFHGFQSDPLRWIMHADALLLPSIIEGLPGVILESFYCQTPVVAYNVGGIGEVVQHQKTGYLVQKGNESAFADAVVHCITNGEQKEEIVHNAFELVTNQYMNEEIAKRFSDAYELSVHSQPASVKKSVTI